MGFSDNLREELKADNIKVTALMPGATYSRSWADSGAGPEKMMAATDVSNMIWAAYTLSANADVEQIVMRPLMGDLYHIF
jgi:short-subunit dehydrogenase